MTKIKIVALGKIREKYLKDAIAEYVKRLSRFCKLEIAEADDEKIPAEAGDAQVEQALKAEAGRALAKVRDGSFLVALDIGGDAPDSVAFAKRLEGWATDRPEITFLIGGSCGLHPQITARADYLMSMSRLTFPHQLARLILLEQIYRAYKIMSHETYHK